VSCCLCLFILDMATLFDLFCVFDFSFVNTSASDCLETLMSEMT